MNMEKIYTIPEKYLKERRWVNFLMEKGRPYPLACWYIGPETGRLFGVYRNSIGPYLMSYRIEGESFVPAGNMSANMYDIQKNLSCSPASGVTPYMLYFMGLTRQEPGKPAGKIIPFPGCKVPDYVPPSRSAEPAEKKNIILPRVLIARPGDPVPPGIPDFRDKLQRDGLILLCYSRGFKKSQGITKKFWIAFWVKSSGDLKRYESDYIYTESDMAAAAPDALAWNWEKGGFSQSKYSTNLFPWVVYVEPDLIEPYLPEDPRPGCIARLKSMGSTVDFGYNYLLTNEKRKRGDIVRERKRRALLWQAKRESSQGRQA